MTDRSLVSGSRFYVTMLDTIHTPSSFAVRQVEEFVENLDRDPIETSLGFSLETGIGSCELFGPRELGVRIMRGPPLGFGARINRKIVIACNWRDRPLLDFSGSLALGNSIDFRRCVLSLSGTYVGRAVDVQSGTIPKVAGALLGYFLLELRNHVEERYSDQLEYTRFSTTIRLKTISVP